MKKTLLFAAFLGLSAAAQAQVPGRLTGPWTEVNVTNVQTPAIWAVAQLVALSPTFMWGIGYDGTSTALNPPRNTSIRTANAAGTEFDYSPITGTLSFQPANISVPAGVPGNLTAFCGQYENGIGWGGSEVIRTTNGGVAWRKISTNQMFALPDGFCNWVHAFDANTVVAAGDPNPQPVSGTAPFEVWYTANASAPAASAVTWTRASTPAALDADEFMSLGVYAAVGNTLWAGTVHSTSTGPVSTCRVLRSTDQGRTWTAHPTPMTGEIQHIAFKDARHGVAFSTIGAQTSLMTTADGGLTWALQALPDPATADTVRGKFYRFGVAAIPNLGFVSFGDAVPGSRLLQNRGASFSCEGVGKSWTDVDKERHTYISADFVQAGATGYRGYFGGFTRSGTVGTNGGFGGLYQINAGATTPACVLPIRPATAGPVLQATPNPSPDGRFRLALPAAPGTGAEVTVLDALGRLVLRRTLLGTTVPAGSWPLDLSAQPPGVYTLRLSSSTGTAVQKLVVE